MMSFFRVALVVFLTVGFSLVGVSGRASTVRALTLLELVQSSQAVAVVTPVSSEVVGRVPSELMRKVSVRVDDCVLGSCGEMLHVYLRGGQKDGLVKVVPGEAFLEMGRQSVVFLRRDKETGPWQVAGLSQGAFQVFERGGVSMVQRSVRGLTLLGQSCRQSSQQGVELSCPGAAFEDRLDAFLSRVRALVPTSPSRSQASP
jgi:hypothetical protein